MRAPLSTGSRCRRPSSAKGTENDGQKRSSYRNLASSARESGELAANLIIANPDGGPTHSRMRMNLQLAAETTDADAATIELGEGVAADLLRDMKLGKLIGYQHAPVQLGQNPG